MAKQLTNTAFSIVLVLLLFTGCQSSEQQIVATEQFNQLLAQAHGNQNDNPTIAIQALKQAEALIDENFVSNKQLVWLHQTMGYLYLQSNQYALAYQQLTKAITLNEDKGIMARLYDYLSELHYKTGNYNDALAFTQLAIELYGNNGNEVASLYFLRSLCFREQGNYTMALATAGKALDIAEKMSTTGFVSNIYNSLGNLYAAQNDYPKAIEYYKKALAQTTAPKSIAIRHHLLGHAQMQIGQTQEAEANFLKAIELKEQHQMGSNLVNSYYNYAQLLKETGREAQGQAYLQQAVAASAGLPISEAANLAHTELARLYTAEGNYQQANAVHAQHTKLLAARAQLAAQLQAENRRLQLSSARQQLPTPARPNSLAQYWYLPLLALIAVALAWATIRLRQQRQRIGHMQQVGLHTQTELVKSQNSAASQRRKAAFYRQAYNELLPYVGGKNGHTGSLPGFDGPEN